MATNWPLCSTTMTRQRTTDIMAPGLWISPPAVTILRAQSGSILAWPGSWAAEPGLTIENAQHASMGRQPHKHAAKGCKDKEPRHLFDLRAELLDSGVSDSRTLGKRFGRKKRVEVIGDFSHLHQVTNDLVVVFNRSGLDGGSCPVSKRMKFLHDRGRRDRLVQRLAQDKIPKPNFHQ